MSIINKVGIVHGRLGGLIGGSHDAAIVDQCLHPRCGWLGLDAPQHPLPECLVSVFLREQHLGGVVQWVGQDVDQIGGNQKVIE